MDKILEGIIKDFVSVRSVITLGAFLTLYFMVWAGKVNIDIVVRIVDMLLAFWFGSKVGQVLKKKKKTRKV